LRNVASLPFIHKHVAVMPDCHFGFGATVGSVIPTKGAIIPSAVGVDIGCGMVAVRTGMESTDLPTNLKGWRSAIEHAVPTGAVKGASHNKGGYASGDVPKTHALAWANKLDARYQNILAKHKSIFHKAASLQLGTLGSGNHFIEICLDEADRVWLMLHSGSRGPGNIIGRYFTDLAKEEMSKHFIHLPDRDLAYLPEGTQYFDDYIEAMEWGQDFARINRDLMVVQVFDALKREGGVPQKKLLTHDVAVNCHHNYTTRENHYGDNVWLTRKGAVCARKGVMGIIPGSMGAKSFIVEGKGNPESFDSCSHGAGRVMSRSAAKKQFTLDDHIAATEGVECRKDIGVLDETPGAYKSIDSVMKAQESLVEIKHTLKQVLCVKG
jgi:tRNA-splicing ligase RtcB